MPVLEIEYYGYHGRRTKDILGGPKGKGPKKRSFRSKFALMFEVFAFCGRKSEVDSRTGGGAIKNALYSIHEMGALLLGM